MKVYYCAVSGEPIPEERVEALEFLGVPERHWTKKEYSTTRKIKGVYAGEYGTSQLILASNLAEEGVQFEPMTDSND